MVAQKRSLVFFIKAVILILLFISFLHPPVDLDLGWHLRYGQYFFETGQVLKDNIISYVWPDYQWVQASWGYDLVVYWLFSNFGFFSLSLSAALVSLATFLMVSWPLKRYSVVQFLILAFVFVTQTPPLWGTGLRSQTPSTLFFAVWFVLTYRAFTSPKFSKLFLLMPILSLVWANMHGGFALGLILQTFLWTVYFGLKILGKLTKRALVTLSSATLVIYGGIIGLSWLTPLLNPWGIRIYEETFKHSTNVNLNIITEWMPLNDVVAQELVWLIFLVILALIFLKRQFKLVPFFLVLTVITYLTFSAMRFIINFGVLSTFLLGLIFRAKEPILWPKFMPKLAFSKQTAFIPSLVMILAILGFVIWDAASPQRYFPTFQPSIFQMDWKLYCDYFQDCSEELTQVMLKDPPRGHGFHPYNIGGYLSWRVPQVKTYIDGRMSAWEDDQGNSPPIVDGDNIIYSQSPIFFRKYDGQYNFSWAIVPTHSAITIYLDQLVKNGLWQKRFQNQNLTYYVKI